MSLIRSCGSVNDLNASLVNSVGSVILEGLGGFLDRISRKGDAFVYLFTSINFGIIQQLHLLIPVQFILRDVLSDAI